MKIIKETHYIPWWVGKQIQCECGRVIELEQFDCFAAWWFNTFDEKNVVKFKCMRCSNILTVVREVHK